MRCHRWWLTRVGDPAALVGLSRYGQHLHRQHDAGNSPGWSPSSDDERSTMFNDWVVAPDFGGVRGGLQGFFQRRRRGSGSYSGGQFSAERLETAR
jgi:hypothetical protein